MQTYTKQVGLDISPTKHNLGCKVLFDSHACCIKISSYLLHSATVWNKDHLIKHKQTKIKKNVNITLNIAINFDWTSSFDSFFFFIYGHGNIYGIINIATSFLVSIKIIINGISLVVQIIKIFCLKIMTKLGWFVKYNFIARKFIVRIHNFIKSLLFKTPNNSFGKDDLRCTKIFE